MIKRILLATSALALLGAPALAGEDCGYSHRTSAQTAQSDEALPQSTPSATVEQADASVPDATKTTETTVAAVEAATQE